MKSIKFCLPEIMGIIVASSFLALWYLLFYFLENYSISLNFENVMKFITVVSGAFVGASFAFFLKKYDDKRNLEKDRIFAFNNVLFVIGRQLNAVALLKKSLNEHYHKVPEVLALQMPPINLPPYEELKYNIEELQFLIKSEPKLLLELTVEQEAFIQIFDGLNMRNELHISIIQPAIEMLISEGIEPNTKSLKSKIGERQFFTIQKLTKGVIDHRELSENSLLEIFSKVRCVALKQFPKEDFISVEIPVM